jgi:DNA processing protein
MLGVQAFGPRVPRRVADGADPQASGCGAEPMAELSGQPAVRPCLVSGAGSTGGQPDGSSATVSISEGQAWLVLLSVEGLGPMTLQCLLARFGSGRTTLSVACGPRGAEILCDASRRLSEGKDAEVAIVVASPGGAGCESEGDSVHDASRRIGPEMARRICDAASQAGRIVDRVTSLGLAILTLEDPEYPRRLRAIEMPPPLLFLRGDTAALNPESAVAVVGTRSPTDRGRLTAGWIAGGLAAAGAVVVSGMAVGIDGAAHAAAVAEGVPTLAVLGGGHARLFPRAHERLANAIVAGGGAVLSELPPDTAPTRGTFPRRNRLVSGMSDATVVVEAGRRSGALITAGWALEQGRECFLVPGPLDAPASAGCNYFLRSFPGQARVVCGVPELLEDLGLAPDRESASSVEAGSRPATQDARGAPGARTTALGRPTSLAPASGRAAALASLGPVERTLAEALAVGPTTADELASRTGHAPAAILSALTLLELRGLATASFGRYLPSGALARR